MPIQFPNQTGRNMGGNKPGVVLNCRTCTRACKEYKSLQDEIEIGPEGNTTLAHMLNFCSNLSFEPQDGVLMPQHICLPCLQMLQQAFTFKRMVIDSDELLRLGLEEVDGTPTDTTGSPIEISPFTTKTKSSENNNDNEYVMIEMLSDELNAKRLAKIEIEEGAEQDQDADTESTHPEEFLLDEQNSNADADTEGGDADCMTEDGLDSLTDFQATDIEYVTIETEYDSQAEDDDDIEIMDDSQCLDTVSEQMQIQMLDDQMVILSGEEPIDEVIGEDEAEHLLDIEREEHLLPGDSDDGEEYLDESRDDGHLIVAGQGGEVLPHVCTVCHKAFRQLCRLNQHMRSHVDEKLHTCEVCGKKLKHLRNYKEHMLTHTNVKPHQCLVCARFYRTTSSLAAHMRTHAEDKPYKCEQCGRSYAAFDHLRRHKLTHTGERPYACDLCDKAYYDSSSLRQHKISHTGEKAFTCEICGVGLSQKSGYKKHMLVHSGEKPHKCHICGRAFTFTSNLNAHVRLHSGEKPFKCDKCMKAFPTKKRLVSHQRVHNKEAPVTTTGAAGSSAHAERIAVVAANRRAALNMNDGMDHQVSTSKVVVVL